MEWFRLEEVEDALNEHAVDDPEEVASMVDTWVTLLFLNISLFFFCPLFLSLTHTTHTHNHIQGSKLFQLHLLDTVFGCWKSLSAVWSLKLLLFLS